MADHLDTSRMEHKRAEMLADVASLVERLLLDCGMSPVESESVGNATANMLADDWGGQNFTIPKDYYFRIGMRDLAIHDEWSRGGTFDALARKHGMGERGMRKLIERVSKRLARQRRGNQLDLLDPSVMP